MATLFASGSITAESKKTKVVVVGAGLAGLTAAYRLHQGGMDVDVYEARSRVGGRVLTAIVEGLVAELGGHNITDGGDAINLRRLIDECGLELTGDRIELNQTYFIGNRMISWSELMKDKKLDPEVLRARLNELVPKSKNMRQIMDDLFAQDDPLYKAITVRLAAFEGGSLDDLAPCYAETLYYILLGGIAAAHHHEDGNVKYIEFLSIKGGNSQLPEKMAKALGEKLHLSMPLTGVAKDANDAFVLTFRGGQIVKADILVLAIPGSVYGDITFEEGILPLEKLEAIKNIHYGKNAKILFPFPKLSLKSPALINERAICYFDVFRSILTLYYTGEASRFTQDNILETYLHERPMLEKGFPDCPPLIAPVMGKDQPFESYDVPIGYSWPNDPYAKGSYSYIAPGQETLLIAMHEEQDEMVKTLFAPLSNKLYFAGEHTSTLTEAPGTMEAACESGERAARMILSLSLMD